MIRHRGSGFAAAWLPVFCLIGVAAAQPVATPPAAAPIAVSPIAVSPVPPAPPAGASATTAASDSYTLNFVNADIDAVVRAVGEITGRNFLVDPRVKGTVNIVSARPVPKSLVYPTLLAALRMQGFAAVESDGVVKIVPEAEARTQSGTLTRGSAAGSAAAGERIVTQVIMLRHESAAQMVTVLRPLVSPANTISAYIPNNAIIVTDYADNVKRIDRVVASLDQPPGEPMLVRVRNASALDIVATLDQLLAPRPGQPGTADLSRGVTLVADARSNSVLIRSDNAARSAEVRTLVEELDTPQRAGGNVYIVYLKNADAAQVAETLRGLYGENQKSTPFAFPAPSPSPQGAAQAASLTGSTAMAPSAAATSPLQNAGANASPSAFSAAGAMIQADVANNAIVIRAPEPVYNNLRAVIERLDTRRAQVYVEALIVEVTADKSSEFGVQWQTLTGATKGNIQGIGGTNFGARGGGTNIIDASVNLGSLANGLNLGIINGTVTIPGLGVISNLALLIRALESDSSANILSTPTLLTLDNEEARIIVGQNVPFITGQYATTGSTSTVQPFQTIDRKDIGLVLRVRPQITEGGAVRLSIYQEVSAIQDNSAAGPILSKRALESNVIVDDDHIVVLGGLIQDNASTATQKLPWAGDIPIFGSLFRYDSRERQKTNLMIFLKPTIVRGPVGGAEVTSQRYDYLRGLQQQNAPAPAWFWKDPTAPQGPTPYLTPPGSVPPAQVAPPSSPASSPPSPPPSSPPSSPSSSPSSPPR
ncbi:MAG: type II secretion system secretin GspD [Proteobacteria bacterium]|nr:type II secretion system secretin GspD [Pseudomonadota bacterium]